MSKTKLFKFNVKNVMYAIKNAQGEFTAPKDLAYATSISLEANYNETKLRGDGEVIGILASDKGKTGTLGVTNVEKEYEVDMGRALEIVGGTAEIQQRKSVEHAIYFETDAVEEGRAFTIKTWLFNVTTGKPSETYNQTEDDPTINGFEYSLSVLGDYLKNTDGTINYDEDGNATKVYKLTSFPGDAGYDTFENSVPTPTVKTL